MQNNSRFMLLGIVVGVILGFLGGSIFARWSPIANDFFKVSLTDILGLVLTATIAVFLTLIVRGQVEMSYRRREIISGFIESLGIQARNLWDATHSYNNGRTRKSQTEVLGGLKILSASVSDAIHMAAIERGIDVDNGDIAPLESAYFNLKQAISDSPFGQKGKRFTPRRISRIAECYTSFVHEVNRLKIGIYS